MPAIAEATDFTIEDTPRVVLATNREDVLGACAQQMTLAGFLVSVTACSAGVLEMVRRDKPPLMIVDLSLPNAAGLEVLEAVQREKLETSIIAVSRDGSLKLAVTAMKLGAFDYLPEPFESDRLISVMCRALGRASPPIALEVKRRQIEGAQSFFGLSPAMREVCGALEDAGSTTANAMITGPAGIGRDICARAIHARSARRHQPFVTINCAALPKALVEAELFGCIAGAFPGAVTDRTAVVTEAHGGTLFIDEICDLDHHVQRKVLRLARDGSFQRLGSDTLAQVDLRIICATSQNPELEVKEGRLLAELFDNISTTSIHLPALRQRGKDTMLMARYFLFGKHSGDSKALQKFMPAAAAPNRSYGGPGGARELQTALLDAITMDDDGPLYATPAPKSVDQTRDDVQSPTVGLTPAAPVDLAAVQQGSRRVKSG